MRKIFAIILFFITGTQISSLAQQVDSEIKKLVYDANNCIYI